MKFKVGDKVRVVMNDDSSWGKSEYRGKYTIESIMEDEYYCIILKEDNTYLFSVDELVGDIPNNVLSRVIYPNYIVSDCGKYLTKEDL